MKTILISILLLISSNFLQAQQVTLSEIARQSKFTKIIDEINNGKQKIKYSDIQGIPYYSKDFLKGRVGDTSSTVPIRYNTFLDTIEILVNSDVYEIPKEDSYPKFTIEKTNERLVLVNTYDDYAGYFFELTSGKNRILKKIITHFRDAVPAPNSLIAGTPARFETLKPIYFIKTEDSLIKIPKNTKDLPALFPEKKDEISAFLKSNTIKTNNEADLIKLANFFNN